MHSRELAALSVLLPFGITGVFLQKGAAPEGCSDDQSFYDWRHCESGGGLNSQRIITRAEQGAQGGYKCAAEFAISSPSEDQLTHDNIETHMSQILSSVAPVTDMVYILCTRCNDLRVPQYLHNVLLIDGRESDKCMPIGCRYVLHDECYYPHVPRAANNDPDTTTIHSERVSFAHRAAVAHAISTNLSNITIIEEDVMINPMHEKLPDFNGLSSRLQVLLAESHSQLVRFTSLPVWEVRDGSGACKRNRCKCHSVAPDLCLLHKGCKDVHDSSFYMMQRSLFDKFIAVAEISRTLDMEAFASFDSVLVTPPITYQKSFECNARQCDWSDQDRQWRKYNDSCVVRPQLLA